MGLEDDAAQSSKRSGLWQETNWTQYLGVGRPNSSALSALSRRLRALRAESLYCPVRVLRVFDNASSDSASGKSVSANCVCGSSAMRRRRAVAALNSATSIS
jgi:hypothetical protein